jgi:poly(A) polymerase
MLPHLLAGYPGTDESIALLEKIDRRTASGIPIEESFAIAALYLRLFMDICPHGEKINISEVLHKANEIIVPHCHYFSIASGIRHQARELLIGCFRLARGRGFRGERRFLQHPFTPRALELFTLWSEVRPELEPLLANWSRAIEQQKTPNAQNPPQKRRRNNRRRKKPQQEKLEN